MRRQQANHIAGKDNEGKPKKVSVKEPIPEPKKAQARDTVGEKVGTSGKTAEQSAFCVQVMDALDKIGKPVEAHQVWQLLRKAGTPRPPDQCSHTFWFFLVNALNGRKAQRIGQISHHLRGCLS
jgi:hypothetical protein